MQSTVPADGNQPSVLSPPEIDIAAARAAVFDLLTALGVSPDTEVARNTPARVAAGLVEILTPLTFELTTFPNTERHHDLMIVRDIAFRSVCAHHLLPFTGTAVVAYLPGVHLVGLSKLVRVVRWFAARLQVQEEMTQQIAGWLQQHLAPHGVGVVINAEHLCMSLRGALASGAKATSVAVRGALATDAAMRSEFLQFAAGR